MNIVSDNGNKYLFNGETIYSSSRKYGLYDRVYTIENISIQHPIAILNSNKPNILYEINNSTPIEISVSGGQHNANSNGDYFTFRDSDNNIINISDGSFRFMRGKTYRFTSNGINSSHSFKVFYNGNYTSVISGSNSSFDITIPVEHSTTLGDLHYKCGITGHGMQANMQLFYRQVNESNEIIASYDFYYGTINIIVTGDFNEVSAYCYYHGYMGGQNLLKYSTTCQI